MKTPPHYVDKIGASKSRKYHTCLITPTYTTIQDHKMGKKQSEAETHTAIHQTPHLQHSSAPTQTPIIPHKLHSFHREKNTIMPKISNISSLKVYLLNIQIRYQSKQKIIYIYTQQTYIYRKYM